jgi:glucose-1-phosphate thymidylyltransferase
MKDFVFVVAAGGSGTRMAPVTKVLNKHLIPTGPGELMIDHPLRFARDHNVDELVVVTGSNHASQVCEYVQDGEKYGFKRISYVFQTKPAGIADVFNRIAHFPVLEGVWLILGDNYFEKHQPAITLEMTKMCLGKRNACCFEYDLGDPVLASRFGQVCVEGEVTKIVEKPTVPVHGRILTGLYFFPADVFERVSNLAPSKRNELEITDLLALYLQEQRLTVYSVQGKWADLGEHGSWMQFVAERHNGLTEDRL